MVILMIKGELDRDDIYNNKYDFSNEIIRQKK